MLYLSLLGTMSQTWYGIYFYIMCALKHVYAATLLCGVTTHIVTMCTYVVTFTCACITENVRMHSHISYTRNSYYYGRTALVIMFACINPFCLHIIATSTYAHNELTRAHLIVNTCACNIKKYIVNSVSPYLGCFLTMILFFKVISISNKFS